MSDKLKLFVEFFSALTGASFVLSAALHTFLFALWGLDFTAIASVEDVVMGSVRMLVTFCTIGIAYAAGVLISFGPQRWLAFKILFVIGVFSLVISMVLSKHNLGVSVLSIATAILGAIVFILASKVNGQKLSNSLAEVKAPRYSIIVTLLLTSLFTFMQIYSGYRQVLIETEEFLPQKCHNAYVRVLWIGSRSVVVRCAGRIHVVRGDAAVTLAVMR